MIKILCTSIALFFVGTKSEAQTVVYSENFGIVTANTPVSSHTFQNTNVTYTSVTTPSGALADIRVTTPSTGYTGASGDACVFIPGIATAKVEFIIEGIDTSNYEDLALTLGHYKGVNAANNELTIEVSDDGTTWTPLTYTRQTGSGTSSWILLSPQGTIPTTANLRIRFTNDVPTTGVSVGFRIDDLMLTGNEIFDASVDTFDKAQVKLYPNPVTNGIVYIDVESKEDVNVELFDVAGKKVLSGKTVANSIDVSSVKPGVYFLKIIDFENSTTQKLIIK